MTPPNWNRGNPFADEAASDPEADKTYYDPDSDPPKFVTENRHGEVREATPEEIEATTDQWEQYEKDAKTFGYKRAK